MGYAADFLLFLQKRSAIVIRLPKWQCMCKVLFNLGKVVVYLLKTTDVAL